ncbi:hypothetical protein ACIBG8_16525 [Nonomuraea sp. NPDC050556]|uniref:hypothetical protein n=1 Tax=Nonomuraea sp. NPDC050556 TaxID=3364369 RepID=UPI0037AC0AD9
MLRWHRPLMFFAVLMAILTPVFLVLFFTDPRTLGGVPLWAKPLKFAASFAIYSFTWAWLLSLRHRASRTGWWMGTALVIAGAAEVAIIFGQAARNRHSHFNEATELDAALWKAMGVTIGVLLLANIVAAILLLLERQADRVMTWAVRAGLVISAIGLSLGGLMVVHVPGQSWAEDMAGAHSVGVQDGGAGLPLFGWSTVGGDLRVPHFIGMHALQLLPLLAFALTRLVSPAVALRLTAVATVAYAGLLGIVTWQALRGQSLVHPDALTLSALAVLLVVTLGGAAASVTRKEPVR